MSNYNFQKLRKSILPIYRVTLSTTQLHLPIEVYEMLGSPKTILVHYDVDNKAIKLEPHSDDPYARSVKVMRDRYYSLSLTLSKFMPKGVYPLKDKEQYIFQQEES